MTWNEMQRTHKMHRNKKMDQIVIAATSQSCDFFEFLPQREQFQWPLDQCLCMFCKCGYMPR